VYGEFANVLLTDGEYKKLIARFGEVNTKEKVKTLSEYIESKGKKYKSHYATILVWHGKDVKEAQQNGKYKANVKRAGTKLPDRNSYTEPPYDSRLDPGSADFIGTDSQQPECQP